MIRVLARLALVAVLALAGQRADAQSQSVPVSPAGASGFSASQRQEIVEIVRNALKADPTILRDAIIALRDEEGQRQEEASRQSISAFADQLNHAPGDPTAGNPNGDVTLVEFYDVRCPYCRRMLPVVAELLKRDRNIRLVYKDIPVLGPASVIGAKALLAAQRQGGYLKLHDALMEGTPNIDQDVVKAAAQNSGLDWERLQRDMADLAIQGRIDANVQLAHALQIAGTPAYVVGTTMLPGAVQIDELRDAVALARKR